MNTLQNNLYFRLERIAFRYQPYLPRVAALLAILCTLSIFLYGIFLLEAVSQAGSRTAAERQIHDISSTLSVLEGKYLSATQALTQARATALGYVTPAQISTVVVSGTPSPLSFAQK